MKTSYKLFLILFTFLSWKSYAQISIPKIFSSHMILPRKGEIKIQGVAKGEKFIWFEYRNESKLVSVDRQTGEFEVLLNDIGLGGSFTMNFIGQNDTLRLDDILAGDIFLCAGQSNMQYSPAMLGLSEADLSFNPDLNMRLLKVEVDTDYLPQSDIKGGRWEKATINNIKDFSAVAYFFGKHLLENQNVPIGLLSSNLGATTIETWMSVEILESFEQFDAVTNEIKNINKDFATLRDEFDLMRDIWNQNYYERGIGMEKEWWKEDLDDSDWQETDIPMFWEYLGYENHDGSFWFRKKFDLDSNALKEDLLLPLNQIDDYDITWVNGVEVGRSYGNRNFRTYFVPKEILREKDNQLTIRVFDIGGMGGIYTSAFWGNPILNGRWKFKVGSSIDPNVFPQPVLPNGSVFSHPTLLYNGSIAPLHKLPIEGVIWYQGESNEARGEEYKDLLSGLITSWRKSWNNPSLPFYIVQLANYKKQQINPSGDLWPEIRAAQNEASLMDNVDIACTIDLGEADDIHPKRKKEVGERLARLALHYNYGQALVKSPQFRSQKIENSSILVDLTIKTGNIMKKSATDSIHGFQIASDDGVFEWAKAEIVSKNQIRVYSDKINDPKFVRYAWSDNPGELNLIDEHGLPLMPFRTDDFVLNSKNKKFKFNEHSF